MLLFNLSRVLSFLFSGDAKSIGKSGIGVIRWEIVDLFDNGVGVCDIEKGIGEATMWLLIMHHY